MVLREEKDEERTWIFFRECGVQGILYHYGCAYGLHVSTFDFLRLVLRAWMDERPGKSKKTER